MKLQYLNALIPESVSCFASIEWLRKSQYLHFAFTLPIILLRMKHYSNVTPTHKNGIAVV